MVMASRMTHDDLAMIDYRDDPMVLVLADSDAACARAEAALADRSFRRTSVVGLASSADRLDEGVAPDVVFLEIDADGGPALDRLLDRIAEGARAARFSSIVSTPSGLIDVVAARTSAGSVIQLADADRRQRAVALADLVDDRTAMLHDIGKGGPPVRLQQLSEEVGRIANILATLSDHDADLGVDAGAEAAVSAQQVRGIIRARRLRDQYFGADLFADPAWDMLLDLMAARLEEQRVAVSSLCIAASVPATTALRWIKALTEQGLFVRAADPQDGRRVYIELSETAAAALSAYLRAAQRVSTLLT